jgi:hypothetical protein
MNDVAQIESSCRFAQAMALARALAAQGDHDALFGLSQGGRQFFHGRIAADLLVG